MTGIHKHRDTALLEQTAKVVAAYASSNKIPCSNLTALIGQIHAAVRQIRDTTASSASAWIVPSEARIADSIREDGLISFIDGRVYQALKRHLAAHGLTPACYRVRYGLPDNYPMVASNYTARRSQIAKAMRLGHKFS